MNKTMRKIAVWAALPCLISTAANAAISARITATQAKLDSACGTHNIKVVFMCQNTGYIVDFSQATPQIQQMAGVTNAYYPTLSSDGQWVAYQTGIETEGNSTSPIKGKIWMREAAATGTAVQVADTAYVPRFVQNTPAALPEIVYSTDVSCPQNICYSLGKTLKKQIANKVPQAAQVVYGQGSYYGGLSWDNRYLCSGWDGGPNGFILDVQNGNGTPRAVHTMRVKKNGTNVDTFVSVGVCNISRPASRVFTNSMLYFDFGSGNIASAGCNHPLLGSWLLHTKLFISRYDSEDLRVYDMPSDQKLVSINDANGNGEPVAKEWDFPEWSDHPYYAAASLLVDRLFQVSGDWKHVQNRTAIYLVNLKDSSYTKLVESTDTSYTSTTSFMYPFVNVAVPANFVEDSTWLSKTIWERASNGVLNPNVSRGNKNSLLNANKGTMATMTVYSVLGQKLMSTSMPVASSWTATDALKPFKAGIYFVGFSIEGKKQQIIRWVKTR